jgi:hypothetical protein
MTGGLLFLWINALLTLLVGRLARRLLPGADLPTLVLGALVLFVAVGHACLVGLGLAGMLAPVPLGVLVTLLFALERLRPGRPSALEPAARPAPGLATRAALGAAAGLLLWWGVEVVGGGVGFVWDDLSYHAAIPAWWLRAGSLDLPPLTYQAYYPANAELAALWFLIPFQTDTFANLGVFVWLAMTVAACAVVTRNLDHSPLVACAAMCCFLASSELRFFVGTFSSNDLAITGLGCAALALAWTRPGEGTTRRALLCGAAAGLALGTKVSMGPLVLFTGLFWLARARGPAGSWRAVGAYTVGVLAFGSFWYARNLFLTGNPLFPADIAFLEGPFGAEAQRKTTLIPAIVEGRGSLDFWIEFLRLRLDWPLPLGFAAAAGFVFAAWQTVRERDGARRGYRILLLACGVAFLLAFPFQPFSGTNNRPDSDLNNLIRYLSFPFGLGLILLASRRGERRLLDPLVAVAALAAAASSLTGFGTAGLTWIAVGGVAAAVLAGPLWGKAPVLGRALVVAVPLAWGGIALLEPAKAAETHELMLEFGRPRPLAAGWKALERLPEDARVATVTHLPSSHTLYRPLYGKDLQLQPVPVYWDGSRHDPIHLTWRDRTGGWWWEFDEVGSPVTYRQLLDNLRGAEVEYLFISKWPRKSEKNRDPAWPVPRKLLHERLDPKKRLYAGAYAEIWDVRDLPPPRKKNPPRKRERGRGGG